MIKTDGKTMVGCVIEKRIFRPVAGKRITNKKKKK